MTRRLSILVGVVLAAVGLVALYGGYAARSRYLLRHVESAKKPTPQASFDGERTTRRVSVPVGVILAVAALFALYGGYLVTIPSTAAVEEDVIVTVQGLLHLDGGDAVVEILVVVHPGEDRESRARDALHDLYPDAVELDDGVANDGSGDVQSEQFNPNGLVWDTLPAVVNYNSAGSPVSGDLAALLAALQTWTDAPTSSFAYEYGGATSRCPSLYSGCPGPQTFDGYNDVGWDDLPGGVLGVATYGSQEMDIIIDNVTFVWHTGGLPVPQGTFDLETVNLHELGHGLGLSHSGTFAAVMYPSVSGGVSKRVLHQDDIDGVSFIYPGGSPAPTAVPTPTPPPTATPSDATPTPGVTQTPPPSATPSDATPTPSGRQAPPTATPSDATPTPINTPAPAATNTPTAAATNTPAPPATSTPLPTPTDAPAPTATPADATPTPSGRRAPPPTATPWEATPFPTNTPTPITTSLPTATATPTPTNGPAPTPTVAAAPVLYVVLASATTIDGLAVENEDILSFDGSAFSLVFDGSDVGLQQSAIDAFAMLDDGSLLLSFAQAGVVPGIAGTTDDSDIVRFVPDALGENTAGSFFLYFDGSDVGLTRNGEDVDAVELLADGRLVISTKGGVTVPGVAGNDEDVLAFSPMSLGAATVGAWAVYLDGSDVGLADRSSEDVDGLAQDQAGKIYLSTIGTFSVPETSGADEDVFVFTPSSTGAATLGVFEAGLFFDGSAFGLRRSDVVAFSLP